MSTVITKAKRSEVVTQCQWKAAPWEICGDDGKFLRRRTPVALNSPNPSLSLKIVDLFCGAGGLSLGLHLAAERQGFRIETRLAVDSNPSAIACYKRNFPGSNVLQAGVESLFSPQLDAPLTKREQELRRELGPVDILAGGPPCQGHSDLNNFSRRNDPKNLLYLYMARAAIVLKPRAVLVENVVGSLHDKNEVVQQVIRVLLSEGFNVDCDFVDFHKIGVPQRRRRLVIKASKNPHTPIADLQESHQLPARDVKWAIHDIVGSENSSVMDTPSKPKAETQARIDYLFANEIFELPNSQRPPCHRDKAHSYDTVYGRLHWDRPSQTITSGFYCMCMGRYVHPSLPRTLTAREAARLQFFPDYFDFTPAGGRTRIAELVGNAVPPKGAFILGVDLIQSIHLGERGDAKP